MTKYFHYYDPGWESEALECPRCHWRGTFDQGATAVSASSPTAAARVVKPPRPRCSPSACTPRSAR